MLIIWIIAPCDEKDSHYLNNYLSTIILNFMVNLKLI